MDMRHLKLPNATWPPPNNMPVQDHLTMDHTAQPCPWPSLNYYYPQANTSSSSTNNLPNSLPIMLGEPPTAEDDDHEELGAMKEMMFKIAAMQPVDIDPASVRRPRRRNVRISDDPQSVAARHRRERISEKMRILQRLVPGGTKMDTASMLDEAVRYLKFLKRQIRFLQSQPHTNLVAGDDVF